MVTVTALNDRPCTKLVSVKMLTFMFLAVVQYSTMQYLQYLQYNAYTPYVRLFVGVGRISMWLRGECPIVPAKMHCLTWLCTYYKFLEKFCACPVPFIHVF